MTLFGPDEYLHTTKGKINKLGSIVGEETLHEMVENYIPGLDQPGDWSERQTKLFNGYGQEDGNIKGHLSKSIKFIEELDKINRTQEWYNDQIKILVENELKIPSRDPGKVLDFCELFQFHVSHVLVVELLTAARATMGHLGSIKPCITVLALKRVTKNHVPFLVHVSRRFKLVAQAHRAVGADKTFNGDECPPISSVATEWVTQEVKSDNVHTSAVGTEIVALIRLSYG